MKRIKFLASAEKQDFFSLWRLKGTACLPDAWEREEKDKLILLFFFSLSINLNLLPEDIDLIKIPEL